MDESMKHSVTGISLLHIEDDSKIADLVKAAFRTFGYSGQMVTCGTIKEAFDLLDLREQSNEPFSLILTDMSLPDGTGLDLLREVRASHYWHLTPVIVLSGEMAPGVIDGAYALGANCYVPKLSTSKSLIASLSALYECWIEGGALLPRSQPTSRILAIWSRFINQQTRVADFYMGLARFSEASPEESGFWLNRALYAGNLVNLLVFLREKLSMIAFPSDLLERIHNMQSLANESIVEAEKRLRVKPPPSQEEVFQLVLSIVKRTDEDVFVDGLGLLFPPAPAATVALKNRSASQMREVATYVLKRTEDPLLRHGAEELLASSHRITTS